MFSYSNCSLVTDSCHLLHIPVIEAKLCPVDIHSSLAGAHYTLRLRTCPTYPYPVFGDPFGLIPRLPLHFLFFYTVFRQVVFWRPTFSFTSGSHVRVARKWLPSFIPRTCPIRTCPMHIGRKWRMRRLD